MTQDDPQDDPNTLPRTGRPKLTDDERRENILRICLTDTEQPALDAAAASDAETSTWARAQRVTLAAKPLRKSAR